MPPSPAPDYTSRLIAAVLVTAVAVLGIADALTAFQESPLRGVAEALLALVGPLIAVSSFTDSRTGRAPDSTVSREDL